MGELDAANEEAPKSIFVQLQEAEKFYKQFGNVKAENLPVIYSSHYNISFYGLEKMQNFDSYQYSNIVQELIAQKAIQKHQIIAPITTPSLEQLTVIHTKEYLDSLHSPAKIGELTEIGMCARIPNFLLKSKVLTPMLYAVSGTILAAKVALDRGYCINLSGGYSQASSEEGGAFCIYSDVSISLRLMRHNYPHIQKIMIVDLGAHQGKGHERDKLTADDKDLFILDVFNRNLPGDAEAKAAVNIACELKSWVADVEYLKILQQALDTAFQSFTPQIVFFIGGTDVLASDPSGLLNISPEGIIKRDAMVFKECKQRNIPLVITLGRYQKSNAKLVADSMANILSLSCK